MWATTHETLDTGHLDIHKMLSVLIFAAAEVGIYKVTQLFVQ